MMKSIYVSLRFLVLIILLHVFVDITVCEHVKKSVESDNREDTGENDENNESMDIVPDTEPNNLTCTRRQNSQLHEITAAKLKQFPFMAAIMSRQNEYLCSGAVVSNGMILTTAVCTEQSISYVLLNTTKDKKDENAVMLHVTKSEKFANYAGGASTKNVGLVYTAKHNSSVASKIRLSNYTSLRGIEDVEGIGFGLNAEVGQTRELQYVGMEYRARPMLDPTDLLIAYFDCVDTKVPVCYRDTGGPVIFDNELLGIVIKGQDECTKETSSMYYTNKRLADVLPTFTFKAWLDERILKNEEQDQTSLVTYPLKPALRTDKVHIMTASGGNEINPALLSIFIISLTFVAW